MVNNGNFGGRWVKMSRTSASRSPSRVRVGHKADNDEVAEAGDDLIKAPSACYRNSTGTSTNQGCKGRREVVTIVDAV